MSTDERADRDPAVPRLLFIVNVAWFFTSHRLPLALAARQAGYEVHVAAAVEGPDEAEAIRQAGLPFHQIRGTRGRGHTLKDLAMFVDILRVIRHVRPDIVHAITAKPIVFAGIASRLGRVRVFVAALTGLGYLYVDDSRHRLLRALVTRLVGLALSKRGARLIVQNRDDAEVLLRSGVVSREQVVLIAGSGVDTRRLVVVPEPPAPPLVILPARMLRHKGIEQFCAAARTLRDDGVVARYALVGGLDLHNPAGIHEAELTDLCRGSGVEWWGYRSDMQDVLAGCHIVCLPSFYREGVPKSLLEAAAVGRAIVTTDVPGCRDVVKDGVDGLVVPPRDPVRLADALRRLIEDADLRRMLGRAAAERVRREFDVGFVVDRTLRTYQDALFAAAGTPT
ncbi:MAG: glycosyltransferase family 4 protein [Dehalococcoidia bacterium]